MQNYNDFTKLLIKHNHKNFFVERNILSNKNIKFANEKLSTNHCEMRVTVGKTRKV